MEGEWKGAGGSVYNMVLSRKPFQMVSKPNAMRAAKGCDIHFGAVKVCGLPQGVSRGEKGNSEKPQSKIWYSMPMDEWLR